MLRRYACTAVIGVGALLVLTGCSGGGGASLKSGIEQTIDAGFSAKTVEFSPDGHKLSVASGGRVALWEITGGHAVKSSREFVVPKGSIYATAWSPDSKSIAVTGDGLYLWNVETGEDISATIFTRNRGSLDVAFSPDGNAIATAEVDGLISLWDGRTLEEKGSMGPHSDKASAVGFSPDSRRLASGGWDKTVRVWDIILPSAEAKGSLEQDWLSYTDPGGAGQVDDVRFSADGKVVAVIEQGSRLWLWNAADGAFIYKDELQWTVTNDGAVAASPRVPIFAATTTGRRIRFVDSRSGVPVGTPLDGYAQDERILSLSFSPDGSTLASGGSEGTVRLRDVSKVRPA